MKKIPISVILGIIASLICLIGSVMPWAEYHTIFGDVSISGLEGDGNLTLLFSIITLVLIICVPLLNNKNHIVFAGVIILLLSILIGMIALNADANLIKLNPSYPYSEYGIHSGAGLTFVEIGAFIMFFSSIFIMMIKPDINDKKSEFKRRCPGCGRPIAMDYDLCPYCGKDFRLQK